MNEINKKTSGRFMTSFILKMLVLFSILFILDFSIGRIIKYFYFKQNSGFLYRTTYALEQTKAELLIMGSSYANHHYPTSQYANKLNMTVYNAGRDGNDIFYHYAMLKGILKRYSPKVIILDLNFGGFKKSEASYETMSSLLPYYESHPEMRSIIELRGPFEKYKLISKIYPYNSLIFTIGIGNLEFIKTKRNQDQEAGYIPLFKTWNHEIVINSFPNKYEFDSNKINIYKSFIKDCQKAKVKLYVVVSPRYIKYLYNDPSLVLANNIAKELNIPFYNFFNDVQILQNRDLFADQSHLNYTGAKIFSNKVIDKILQDEKDNLQNSMSQVRKK